MYLQRKKRVAGMLSHERACAKGCYHHPHARLESSMSHVQKNTIRARRPIFCT